MTQTGSARWMIAGWIGCIGAAMPAAAQQIRIWPTASIAGESVRLADVAEITGFETAEAERLAVLELRTAPRAGGEAVMRWREVRDALRAGGVNLANVTLLGARTCKVARPPAPRPTAVESQSVPPRVRRAALAEPESKPEKSRAREVVGADQPESNRESLDGLLRQAIEARLPEHDGRVEVRFGDGDRELLSRARPEYDFVIRPPDGPERDRLLGIVPFSVDVLRDGAVVEPRNRRIVAEVALSLKVVVTRKPLNRGQVIEPRHLRLAERSFTDFDKIGITDFAAAVGQECRQFLRTGDMLHPRVLQAVPSVRRGDSVTIWHSAGGVLIKTSGKAQEDGQLGSTITVRRDGVKRSAGLIDAVVTGPKTVRMASGERLAAMP